MTTQRLSAIFTAAVATLGTTYCDAATFGLDLYNNNSGSLTIDSTNREWSTRFTADKSITIDTATYFLNNAIGSPNLQIAIRADDGLGNPTGPDLAVGASSPSGGGGYRNVTLSPTALVAGQTYHYVYRVTNGDGSNFVQVRTTTGHVGSHTSTGSPENNSALLITETNGGSWTAYTSDVQSWGLHNSATNDAIGQPYTNASFAPLGLDIWQGQSFTFTGSPAGNAVNEISMKIYKGVASAADDLRVYLIDTTDGSAIWSGVLMDNDAAITSGYGDIVSVEVPDVLLTLGRKYILALESIGSAVYDYQMLNNASFAEGSLLGENFQEAYGSDWVRAFSFALPGSFTDMDPADGRYDAYFDLGLTPAAVPEPTSLALLGLGAGALLRRRRSM